MPALYLLRHGIAQPEGIDPPLSEEGVTQMKDEARGMSSLGLSFDVIATSPLHRAEQTARIVAGLLGVPGGVEISKGLAPGCRLSKLEALFDRHRDARGILLVGHQPDMGRIAADLIGSSESLSFDRGMLCCLLVTAWPPRPPATLERMLSPVFLREQAGR